MEPVLSPRSQENIHHVIGNDEPVLNAGVDSRIKEFALSILMVGGGIFLLTSRDHDEKNGLAGGVLISAGVSGGLYAYHQKTEGFSFWNYVKQSGYGAVSGLVSGTMGLMAKGGAATTKIAFQILGSAASNMATFTVSHIGEKREMPKFIEVWKQGASGLFSGTASVVVGAVMNKIFERQVSKIRDEILLDYKSMRDDRILEARAVIIGTITGAVTSGIARLITNVSESRNYSEGLTESSIIGAVLKGGVNFFEMRNIFEIRSDVCAMNRKMEFQEVALLFFNEEEKDVYLSIKDSLSRSLYPFINPLLERFFTNPDKLTSKLNYKNVIHFRYINLNGRNEGRFKECVISIFMIGAGIILITPFGDLNELAGGILISAGVSGGLYAHHQKAEGFSFWNYVKQSGYGAVNGLVPGSIGLVAKGGEISTKIAFQIIGNSVTNMASCIVLHLGKNGRFPKSAEVWDQALLGLVSGTTSAISRRIFNKILMEHAGKLTDDISLFKTLFKGSIVGAVTSCTSKLTINVCASAYGGQPTNFSEGLIESVVIGAFINSSIELRKGYVISNIRAILSEMKLKQNGDKLVLQIIKEVALRFEEMKKEAEIDPNEPDNIEILRGIERLRPLVQFTLDITNDIDNSIKEMETDIRIVEKIYYVLNDQFTQNIGQKVQLDFTGLQKALRPTPEIFTDELDCDWGELVKHVVLVHAINQDSAFQIAVKRKEIRDFLEPDYGEVSFDSAFSSLDLRTLSSLLLCITPQGVIGAQLEFEKQEFNEELADRPHIHWCWNQLVTPNAGGDWEASKIAILEPLAAFEETEDEDGKLFSITPCDSLAMRPHCLSKNAILLVPKTLFYKAGKFLDGIEGKIIPYDDEQNLRSAVIKNLMEYHPDVWHVCNEDGNLIGDRADYIATGHRPLTCLKRGDGKVITILKGSDEMVGEKLKSSVKETKRFLGLHMNSITYHLEVGRNPYFSELKKFKKDHSKARICPLFAGKITGIESLKEFGTLSCLTVYRDLLTYNPSTGTHELAGYLINEAIFADILSLFYQANPDANFEPSVFEIKIIVNTVRFHLIKILEEMKTSLDSNEYESQRKGLSSFKDYCILLSKCLQDIVRVQEKTKHFLEEEVESQLDVSYIFEIGSEEWAKVLPPDRFEFDLKRDWPFSKELELYAHKVIETLPKDLLLLRGVYQKITELIDYKAPKKQIYQMNIIQHLIFWCISESEFISLNGKDMQGVLGFKLIEDSGEL